MKILHKGFDGLEVAFQGKLHAGLRRKLQMAKDNAEQSGSAEYLNLAGVDVWVKGTGAKGGYAFVFDTGPDGEIWVIKNNDKAENWNLRVKVMATQLIARGFEGTVENIYSMLGKWKAEIIAESVARVDFAVDFIADDYAPDMKSFICHSKSTQGEYAEKMDEIQPRQFACGRRITSVTIGMMPGRQIITYDKRREAIQTQKYHWFEIWGIERENCTAVWRIEVRAGKDHLRDYRIKTLNDIRDRIGFVFETALNEIRLIDNPEVENRSRDGITNPIWEEVAGLVSDCMGLKAIPTLKGRITEGRRVQIQDRYSALIKGLASGYAVAYRVSFVDAMEELPERISGIIGDYLRDDRKKFSKNFIRATNRLKFIDDDRGVNGEKSNAGNSGMSGMWCGNFAPA